MTFDSFFVDIHELAEEISIISSIALKKIHVYLLEVNESPPPPPPAVLFFAKPSVVQRR